MTSRRSFFKNFLGQVGVLHDEMRGVENIPLSRLNELPKDIVDDIVPVFFPDEEWEKRENVLYLLREQSKGNKQISLSPSEEIAFDFLKQGIFLKRAAQLLANQLEISYDEAYQLTTCLFFSLASMRICHPREVYDIDSLSKTGSDE